MNENKELEVALNIKLDDLRELLGWIDEEIK